MFSSRRPSPTSAITCFYANANAAATPLVDEAIRTDPNVYPPAEVRAKLFVDKSLPPRQARERTRVWTAFRAGN